MYKIYLSISVRRIGYTIVFVFFVTCNTQDLDHIPFRPHSTGTLPCNHTVTDDVFSVQWYKSSSGVEYINGPDAILSWYTDEITTSIDHAITDDFSLVIIKIGHDNEGIYRCIVRAVGGKDHSIFDIGLIVTDVTDTPVNEDPSTACGLLTGDSSTTTNTLHLSSVSPDLAGGQRKCEVVGHVFGYFSVILVTAAISVIFISMKYEKVRRDIKQLGRRNGNEHKGRVNGTVKSTSMNGQCAVALNLNDGVCITVA